MDEALEQRIRERAFAIWQRENCPEGRAEAHWEMAKEEIAIMDNQQLAARPNPVAEGKPYASPADSAESLVAVEGAPDLPGRSNQGEHASYPRPDRRREG